MSARTTRTLLSLGGALLATPLAALAQAHAPTPRAELEPRLQLGASAIGLVTHTDGPLGKRYTEGYLTQPVLVGGLALPRAPLFAHGMLDLEGLTLARGELNTGAYGEGFVDRRHPHTYLHEAIVGARTQLAGLALSIAGGKGFAPFGTDDPMSRPFVKYPVNHHLAQIPERLVVIAAARRGPLLVEGAVFNGDEPIAPTSPPATARFGDSWATRLTFRPRPELELAGSIARVTAPEVRTGPGLDQRKRIVAARYERASAAPATGIRYALAEWSRTDEYTHARKVFSYASALGEIAGTVHTLGIALRLERTTRPEEQRLLDVFRTPRPAVDYSLIGLTRWEIATLAIERRIAFGHAAPARGLALAPFIEVAHLRPRQELPSTVFVPAHFYGRTQLWSLSAGTRIALGHHHARMGRYGVAGAVERHTADGPAEMPRRH